MKRRVTIVALSALLVAGIAGLVLNSTSRAAPPPRPPKIVKTMVFRTLKNTHSTNWTYYVRVTGEHFHNKSKVEIDGENFPRIQYVRASRDVIALVVELGTWSRVYRKPKKYRIAVTNPDGGRSNTAEDSW